LSKIKIAINGFGRIGRVTARLLQNNSKIELVAINDLVDTKTLAYLLKYDSIHGILNDNITSDENNIYINEHKINVYSERNPENLAWKELDIDIVIESTGFFRDYSGAYKHIEAGAKKVIISAPTNDDNIKTIVMGINDDILDGNEKIISNASCTTNCAAPMIKVLEENCKIVNGFITTTHAYTGDQNIHDAPHKDLRRARAAGKSIIPTSTGAAKAIEKIFPTLKGKLDGSGIRVPVLNGSLTDITCVIENKITKEELNKLFINAANNKLKSVLSYTNDPIVSNDIIGNTASCLFDTGLTSVVENTVKIVAWYDNETGYSARLIDLILKIS